jgi:hypothetical protein
VPLELVGGLGDSTCAVCLIKDYGIEQFTGSIDFRCEDDLLIFHGRASSGLDDIRERKTGKTTDWRMNKGHAECEIDIETVDITSSVKTCWYPLTGQNK